MKYKSNEPEKYNKLIELFNTKIYKNMDFPKFDVNDKNMQLEIFLECVYKN